MALSYDAFLLGCGILLAMCVATYFIGRRSPLRGAAFVAAAFLVLIAINL